MSADELYIVKILILSLNALASLGPDDLTQGTLSPNSSSEIPTVTDGFLSDCEETSDAVGIFFEPTTSQNALNGEISFGGADSAKIQGSPFFTPISESYTVLFHTLIE